MKPFYSITDLKYIFDDPIYKIADALVASGVVPIFQSKPADLSKWGSLAPVHPRPGVVVLRGSTSPHPNPDLVMVASEALPDAWKKVISERELAKQRKTGQQTIFDPADATYPRELHIALQAWQAVSTTEGKGKPKARLKAWLKAYRNGARLTESAIERISTMANWDKKGGATKTE